MGPICRNMLAQRDEIIRPNYREVEVVTLSMVVGKMEDGQTG